MNKEKNIIDILAWQIFAGTTILGIIGVFFENHIIESKATGITLLLVFTLYFVSIALRARSSVQKLGLTFGQMKVAFWLHPVFWLTIATMIVLIVVAEIKWSKATTEQNIGQVSSEGVPSDEPSM